MAEMKSDKEKGTLLEQNILESAKFGGAETSLVAKAFAAVFFIVCLCPKAKVDLIYPEYKVYQGRLVFTLESVRFRFESQFATMYFS